MRLPFLPYDPKWKKHFESIKSELQAILKPLAPQIDHIGSTAVEGLSAKPIIDIQLGVENETDLEVLPDVLKLPNIVYYEKYNQDWPERRFFILLNEPVYKIVVPDVVKIGEEIPAILHDHEFRLAHLHAFVKGSADWVRHIAFRDYLLAHPKVKESYQALKQNLIQLEWVDGNDYNKGKDEFLKRQERNALIWYRERQQ
ncbi:GrpB family protein [Sphingobacterium puteale]|uniref:GrpB family protein n=1 Tax=Sphingobacterium puteale TaxID=2420510 RepID=A0A420W2F8_9SPHI|nr:GrpB family protein [Sphingobacterium puteale]RKO72743.1 GrpB family protein [Sphingobacterium puteale]